MELYSESQHVNTDDMQLRLFWKRYVRRQRILFMTSRSKGSCFRSGKTVQRSNLFGVYRCHLFSEVV